jgi:peroxiredoxin Q/BCP
MESEPCPQLKRKRPRRSNFEAAFLLDCGRRAAYSVNRRECPPSSRTVKTAIPAIICILPNEQPSTPGCTREACAFRDRKAELSKLGARVLGVSGDSLASHAKFRAGHELNFTLLSDADHKVAEKYGAWREKTLYGKKSLGIQRSTFLIDAEGKVARVWKKVNVDGHDEEVLAALRELKSR